MRSKFFRVRNGNRVVKPYLYFCFFVALISNSACVKDKPGEKISASVNLSQAKKVYVINEGNFGSGNASVSLFDPGQNQVVEDIYRTANNQGPGDVAQSLTFFNGNYFLVMNNSGKILVCNPQFKNTGRISGLTSPRFALPVSNSKMYVSDLYAKAISIVDLNQAIKSGSIATGEWTEEMVMVYNKVFVALPRRTHLYVINANEDKISDSVYVGPGVSGLVVDKKDRVWALSAGDATKNKKAGLSCFNSLSLKVESYFEFASGAPGNLCINGTKDTLFYLNSGVCRMPVDHTQLPATAFIGANGRNFYALGVSPGDYRVYVSDALDFVQKSVIYVYHPDGTEASSFKAGINAGRFYFE